MESKNLLIQERADEYDTLREKYEEMLVGGADTDLTDPMITNKIAVIVQLVSNPEKTGFWDTMEKDIQNSDEYIWSDLKSTTLSAEIVTAYSRLGSMAIAYKTKGAQTPIEVGYNPLYNNVLLRDAIIKGLEWMNENRYGENTAPFYNNWYHWEISGPANLLNITTLMYSELTEAQILKYGAAVAKYMLDPDMQNNNSSSARGANRVEKGWNILLCTILTKEKLTQYPKYRMAFAINVFSDWNVSGEGKGQNNSFRYVDSGDGMNKDGTFIFHTKNPYNGNYGATFFDRLVRSMYLVANSQWDFVDPEVKNVYEWVNKAYEPVLFKGALMSMMLGRTIMYATSDDHAGGHVLLRSILLLSTFASQSEQPIFEGIVKYHVESDYFRDYMVASSIFNINLAKKILPEATNRGDLIRNKIFTSGDRVAHFNISRNMGYAMGISMASERIFYFTNMNLENVKGFHTGAGMTYIYTDDEAQFAKNFWATVDMYRLPGVTVDSKKLPNASQSVIPEVSSQSWVGGASNGVYGVAGMQLESYKSTLKAKKSWFMFDNEVVALGSDIIKTEGTTAIETIISNRKIHEAGNNRLTVDGKEYINFGEETFTGVSWMNLEGNVPDSDIGYYFPQATTVNWLREARTGKWSDNNHSISNPPPTDLRSDSFDTVYINHGNTPNKANYAYAILPNATAEDTKNYAQSPGFEILENSESAQGVRKITHNITAINYWNDTIKSVVGVTSNKKASVLFTEKSDSLDIWISDPTWKNTGSIEVTMNKIGTGVDFIDPNVKVVSLNPIKIVVNTADLKGISSNVVIRLGGIKDPEVPELLDANVVGYNSVELKWSISVGAAGFIVEYSKDKDFVTGVTAVDVGYTIKEIIPELERGELYYFRIIAYNAANPPIYSKSSNVLSLVIVGPPQTLRLEAVADSFVESSAPEANYGKVVQLKLSWSNRAVYFKFDISDIPEGMGIESAEVVLYGKGGANVAAGGSKPIRVAIIEDSSWSETGIKWSNKPAADRTNILPGEWTIQKEKTLEIKLDVTELVKEKQSEGSDKLFTLEPFFTENQSSDFIGFHSREATGSILEMRPVLVIKE